MGEGHVSACLGALTWAAFAAFAPAQGVAYRERWTYLHLESRRLDVLGELRGRPADVRTDVARIFAEPVEHLGFPAVAKALARLRGVPADDAFAYRTAVCVYLLPEVADPDGKNEVCREVNVSAFVPCALPRPKSVSFDFDVRDKGGESVWTGTFDSDPESDDVRLGRTSVKVPAGSLADGSYELTVRTRIDGSLPGPADPVLRWPMHVLRGFQARSEAALAAARDLAPADELPAALLAGIAAPVAQAHGGEAFAGRSRAVADLERLELALRNVRAGKPVLSGMTGDVPCALPTGEDPLACVLRLRAESPDDAPRPLVVLAGATPAYDAGVARPIAPASRAPMWLAMELPAFGVRDGFDVVFLESPGGGRDYGRHLLAAIDRSKDVMRTGDRPVVLVCDREAASVAALRVDSLRRRLAGLVLLGSGGITTKALEGLGDFAVRLRPLHGHAGSGNIESVLAWVRSRGDTWRGDVTLLGEGDLPWPFGVPLAESEIAAFAAHCFAR
ncbi:MAG: hypothetical protein JNK78_04625 [Planctomycetes bacterium]|nr:hypothetical protein [Planctomycetota bacterium]